MALLLGFAALATAGSAYAQYTFTTVDYPGGVATSLRGINNHGDMVGGYSVPGQPRHALLIKDGKFIPMAPTTVLGTNYSEAFKINDRGDSVGRYIGDDGFVHGYLLSKKGVLTTLDFQTAGETYANGIDESGTVVGWWDILDADGNLLAEHGFRWEKGTFSEVSFPGSGDTLVWGNNARGDLVGAWKAGVDQPDHGFVSSKKQSISFDVPFPGASDTVAGGINACAEIVGQYNDVDGFGHGFLAVGATFTQLDYPGAVITTAWGINSAGQIVGNWYDSNFNSRYMVGWHKPARRKNHKCGKPTK
jgi:uncharacterized membrane protein